MVSIQVDDSNRCTCLNGIQFCCFLQDLIFIFSINNVNIERTLNYLTNVSDWCFIKILKLYSEQHVWSDHSILNGVLLLKNLLATIFYNIAAQL